MVEKNVVTKLDGNNYAIDNIVTQLGQNFMKVQIKNSD